MKTLDILMNLLRVSTILYIHCSEPEVKRVETQNEEGRRKEGRKEGRMKK